MLPSVSLLVFLLLVSVRPISSYLYVSYNDTNGETTLTMYGPFSTPYYTNLPQEVSGFLIQHNESSSCQYNDIPSPPIRGLYILMLPYSDGCMLDITVYAKSVGYIGILTYGDNATITDGITNTGLPFAIIDNIYVDTLSDLPPNSIVTIYGSITGGVAIVAISFIILFILSIVGCVVFWFFCICCIALWVAIRGEDNVELTNIQRREGAEVREEVAKDIPTKEYDGEGDEETCPICWDELTQGTTIKELPCGHIFHPECIDEWLNGYNLSCPYCKKDVRGDVRGLSLEAIVR